MYGCGSEVYRWRAKSTMDESRDPNVFIEKYKHTVNENNNPNNNGKAKVCNCRTIEELKKFVYSKIKFNVYLHAKIKLDRYKKNTNIISSLTETTMGIIYGSIKIPILIALGGWNPGLYLYLSEHIGSGALFSDII